MPLENYFMSTTSELNANKAPQTLSSRLPLLFILAVLVGLVTYLQWPEAEKEKSKYKRVVAVKMTPVVLAEFIESVEAVGTARANEQVVITSKYSDLVEDVFLMTAKRFKRARYWLN